MACVAQGARKFSCGVMERAKTQAARNISNNDNEKGDEDLSSSASILNLQVLRIESWKMEF